jgi:hypothetical protein
MPCLKAIDFLGSEDLLRRFVDMKPEHRQTRVLHPSGRQIAVDAGLAPLLAALWSEGIETANSCEEEGPGVIWIEFETASGLSRFLKIVARSLDPRDEGRGGLRDRMTRMLPARGFWRYTTNVYADRPPLDGEGLMASDPDSPPPAARRTTVSLRFPVTDYQRVYQLFMEARRSSGGAEEEGVEEEGEERGEGQGSEDEGGLGGEEGER